MRGCWGRPGVCLGQAGLIIAKARDSRGSVTEKDRLHGGQHWRPCVQERDSRFLGFSS